MLLVKTFVKSKTYSTLKSFTVVTLNIIICELIVGVSVQYS